MIWQYGDMASRKMTFTVPESVASEFLRLVPPSERSRYVTEAIADKLRERREHLIQACELANKDPEVLLIEQEWERLSDEIPEPWKDSPAR
jgi:hypothetical protein